MTKLVPRFPVWTVMVTLMVVDHLFGDIESETGSAFTFDVKKD